MKKVLFGNEAREKLVKGVNVLAEAVGSTLGPKGSNVAMTEGMGYPHVVHDGVTVARSIDLEDPFEDMGAQLVKGAAQRTNDVAGDGTTTSTILAQSIVNQGMAAIKKGANPMVLKAEIDQAVEQVITNLRAMAVPVTKEDYKKVATISAQNEKIGEIVAEAISKVGADGVVDVAEGSEFETTIEVKDGMEFDRGYLSPYFLTDTTTLEAVIHDAYILLCDFRINTTNELIPFLEKFIKVSKNIVIVAEHVEGEALRFLVHNRIKGNLNVVAVKAPGYGERRKDWLMDLSFLTGGKVLSEETGKSLTNVSVKDLGRAKKVVCSKDKTKIVDGAGNKKEITKRIKQVQTELKKAKSDFEKKNIKERLAKLTGGIAVITAGASSEVEMREVKERIIDAVNATQSAIAEGVVIGGEMALPYAYEGVKSEIINTALTAPLQKLIDNSGYDRKKVLKQGKDAYGTPNMGFDVMTGEWVNLLEKGIIDPVKVTINAIKNAASVATMILTTNTLVAPVKDKNEEN